MIVSVPHAGNRFVRRLTGQKILHSHIYQRFCDLTDPILVPLRDPKAIWASWCARPVNPETLDPDHPASMESAWRGLACLHRSHRRLLFLPVDCESRREQCLAEISEAIGVNLTTDWEPVGHAEPAYAPERDLAWVYDLPFIREFYS